jgi:hypothetical protein
MNKIIGACPVVLFAGAGASVSLKLLTTEEFGEYLENRSPTIPTALGGQWPPVVADLCKTTRDVEKLLDTLEELRFHAQGLVDIPLPDSAASNLFGGSGILGRYVEAIERTRDAILGEVRQKYSRVNPEDTFQLYYDLVSRIAGASQTVPVFTTNYDWAFESLAEGGDNFHLVDGFALQDRTNELWWDANEFEGFSPLNNRLNLVLFKMHGSTSWYLAAPNKIQKMTHVINASSPAMMYIPPSERIKSDALRGDPYRTAYSYLQGCLKSQSCRLCLIIGSSLRDRGIANTFRDALEQNKQLTLLVIDPKLTKESILDRLGITNSLPQSTRIEVEAQGFTKETAPEVLRRVAEMVAAG